MTDPSGQSRPRFHCSAATHPGTRRADNQDACLSRPDLGLWAVADGAGGHRRGAAAAGAIITALDAIPTGLDAAPMLAEVRARLASVHAGLLREPVVMAATVVVLIARETHFACLWAGDSRAYLARGQQLEALTRDHSLVQELVDAGTLGAAEADTHAQANVITRAVGAAATELALDKVTGPLRGGERFLLCSDGLWKTLAPAELAGGLGRADAADQLLAAALLRGAADNVTAVSVEVPDEWV